VSQAWQLFLSIARSVSLLTMSELALDASIGGGRPVEAQEAQAPQGLPRCSSTSCCRKRLRIGATSLTLLCSRSDLWDASPHCGVIKLRLMTSLSQICRNPLSDLAGLTFGRGERNQDRCAAFGSVPPCASCHGEDAKGNGAFPRLAGQYHAYIEKALANFEKVRGQDPNKPDTSAIMQPIAHVLTEPQIAAVAAYLNQLE
jgi:cytochrome c553